MRQSLQVHFPYGKRAWGFFSLDKRMTCREGSGQWGGGGKIFSLSCNTWLHWSIGHERRTDIQRKNVQIITLTVIRYDDFIFSRVRQSYRDFIMTAEWSLLIERRYTPEYPLLGTKDSVLVMLCMCTPKGIAWAPWENAGLSIWPSKAMLTSLVANSEQNGWCSHLSNVRAIY